MRSPKRVADGAPDWDALTKRRRRELEDDGSSSPQSETSSAEHVYEGHEQEYEGHDDPPSWPCFDEGLQARQKGWHLWVAMNARELLLQGLCPLKHHVGECARAASRVALCVIPCASLCPTLTSQRSETSVELLPWQSSQALHHPRRGHITHCDPRGVHPTGALARVRPALSRSHAPLVCLPEPAGARRRLGGGERVPGAPRAVGVRVAGRGPPEAFQSERAAAAAGRGVVVVSRRRRATGRRRAAGRRRHARRGPAARGCVLCRGRRRLALAGQE